MLTNYDSKSEKLIGESNEYITKTFASTVLYILCSEANFLFRFIIPTAKLQFF